MGHAEAMRSRVVSPLTSTTKPSQDAVLVELQQPVAPSPSSASSPSAASRKKTMAVDASTTKPSSKRSVAPACVAGDITDIDIDRNSNTTIYRDNANYILPIKVDTSASQQTRNQQMIDIATTVCPFLLSSSKMEQDQANDADMITVRPLLGGLSNEIFVVENAITQRAVLIRIHPEDEDEENTCEPHVSPSGNPKDSDTDTDTDSDSMPSDEDMPTPKNATSNNISNSSNDLISHRQMENRLVAWLSQQGMAPIFYGRFENGRVEEFYGNAAPLSCEEMGSHADIIGSIMAKFHVESMPVEILPKPENERLGYAADRIDSWFTSAFKHINEQARRNDDGGSDGSDEQQQLIAHVHELHQEWMWLQSALERPPVHSVADDDDGKTTATTHSTKKATNFIREVVLTHMDCQPLNILKPTTNDNANTTNNIKLIDFEYAGWNPRAADIANTFCEHCNMTNLCPNYETEYPTTQQQNAFLRSYLRQADPAWSAQLDSDGARWDDVLSALRNEVGRFTLVSHMQWAVWSVDRMLRFQRMAQNRASSSSVDEDSHGLADWDYMGYMKLRMDGYHLMKQWFIGSK